MMVLSVMALVACQKTATKIPCYAWTSGPGQATDAEIKAQFEDWKAKGIDGLLYSGGQQPETYARVGKIAKAAGLEFQAWIPTMVQGGNPKLTADLYAVNGKGNRLLTSLPMLIITSSCVPIGKRSSPF